jgi:catalase (peroxidase I)
MVLIQDELFKKYVVLYASNQTIFFQAFAKAFQKLEELGTKHLLKTIW